ncbi:flagellar hook-length control protein FliK [Paenibacillus sp. EC2-1]|uniref:flagellar hook-length control protein FliK n=1 Tax=Paenibacillus sp. EC2-1 TaxID=3388665 RepID=UPI003BEF4947
MTLVFQSTTSTVGGAISGGKTSDNGKTSSVDGFGQALVQQMTNAGTPTTSTPTAKDTAAMMLNASVQMLKDLTMFSQVSQAIDKPELSVTEGNTDQEGTLDLSQMILSLMKDLEKLEEALEKDPSLLQELQAWLMQATTVLSNVQVQGQAGVQQQLPEGELQSIPPLAAHPDTIRFAVQDTLTQLSNMVKNNTLGDQAKSQLMQLAQSFQTLLTEGGSGNSKEIVQNKSQVASAVASYLDGEAPVSVDRKELPVSMKPVTSSVQTFDAKERLTAKLIDGGSTEEAAAGNTDSITEQNFTAGQLALRTGNTAPVKAMAQPVPVNQFANEMTNLVVNKLEFVKLQGFTEARISLNPEHLGQVDIRITMQNGQLVAQFMTRNSDARELIDQQMSQLRSALQGQGLQVEKLEVTQSSQSSSSQFYQEGRQPGSGQQDSNRRSREKDVPSDDAVATAAITEEWNEWLAERQEVDARSHTGAFTASV